MTRREEIADGLCDASFGRGYGVGRYGVGRYGVSKTSTSLLAEPRRYVFARFGNNQLLTPGDQTGLYQWTGTTDTAPTLVTNAPTAINYVYVSNEIINTFGASGVDNRVQWSDQGNSTVWTASPTNLAGQDDIEGADKFISQAQVRGTNLLFTPNQVFTQRFVGAP